MDKDMKKMLDAIIKSNVILHASFHDMAENYAAAKKNTDQIIDALQLLIEDFQKENEQLKIMAAERSEQVTSLDERVKQLERENFAINYAANNNSSMAEAQHSEVTDNQLEAGAAEAQYKLGYSYLFGLGVEKKSQYALELLNQAAQNGSSNAMLCLGDCFSHGVGVKENLVIAAEWYQKALAHGHKDAEERLIRLVKAVK